MATNFITVPMRIMKDNQLNVSQKFILAEIEQLTQLDKGCIASNSHFSELIGISKESVSRNITDLEKKGYISTETINGSRNHVRVITLLNENQNINYDFYVKAWNVFATRNNLNTVGKISKNRKNKIKDRVLEVKNFKETFKKVLLKADGNSFLIGENKKNWKMCFDWVISNDHNYLKVLEGKYE